VQQNILCETHHFSKLNVLTCSTLSKKIIFFIIAQKSKALSSENAVKANFFGCSFDKEQERLKPIFLK